MKTLAKITFALFVLAGVQSLTSETKAAHNGGGVANAFGPGSNNAGGNGNGNNGNGGGNGGNAGAATSGGAQGAPAPLLAASIFGQAIAFGGCAMAWRRRRTRKDLGALQSA